ncbi:hypothetical protein MUP95_00715 [bacterium]|nr:hypothetical protein [bacterium]
MVVEMTKISYQEVVITCEACNTVKKFPVQEYDECLAIFHEYHCPNGCGRNLYSFFTVGKIEKKKK